MGKPLSSVNGVGKTQTNFVFVNGVVCGFGTSGLKTYVVLLVSPANDAGNPELSKELFFAKVFNEELVLLFSEDGLSIAVIECYS